MAAGAELEPGRAAGLVRRRRRGAAAAARGPAGRAGLVRRGPAAPSRRRPWSSEGQQQWGGQDQGQQWPQEQQQWGGARRPAAVGRSGAVRPAGRPAGVAGQGEQAPAAGLAGRARPGRSRAGSRASRPGRPRRPRRPQRREPQAGAAEPRPPTRPGSTRGFRDREGRRDPAQPGQGSRVGGPSLPDVKAAAFTGVAAKLISRSPRRLWTDRREACVRQASRSFAAVLRMLPIADHGLTFVDCRNVISTVSFVGHSVSGTVAERRTDEVRHVDRKPTCTGERTGSRRSSSDRRPDGDCRR